MTPDERETTIRELFPVVRAIARRVAKLAKTIDLDDLIGDGSIGLIRAVDRFDATRGVSLEHFARRLIVGAMLNGLRRRDPVSERVRRTLRLADQRRYALAQERGTLPTLAELERGDGALRRARLAVHTQSPLSLDIPPASGREILIDRNSEPGERTVERARTREIRQAIALLSERERRIIALHYEGELSLHAIGRVLRVSPQRVSQLHLHAIARLRHTVPPS
jgi:RNA polymerase sigma factor for flagellar operon FliA